MRLQLVSLGGSTERYEFLASGRVLHSTGWTSETLRLPAGSPDSLARSLTVRGLCLLGARPHQATGSSKRRMIVEVRLPSGTCAADLPWETWSSDPAARRCLEVIRAGLHPLADSCRGCTIP